MKGSRFPGSKLPATNIDTPMPGVKAPRAPETQGDEKKPCASGLTVYIIIQHDERSAKSHSDISS